MSIRSSGGQSSQRIQSRRSSGRSDTAVRAAADRGRGVDQVAGASGGNDVTRGLDDVSDESRRVGDTELLTM